VAWSSAELPAATLTPFNADKPLLVGVNRLRGLTSSSVRWSTTATWGGADNTDASYPITNLNDDYTHKRSAGASSTTPWYLHIDMGSLLTFDSVFVVDHNFGGSGGGSVNLAVGNDNVYTGVQVIQTWTVDSGSTARLVAVEMDHVGASVRQYTAQYLRFTITDSGGITPGAGEVFIGTRRQLSHNPDRPWDPDAFTTSADIFEGSTGIDTEYIRHRGRRIVRAGLTTSTSAQATDLLAFYKTDLQYGRYRGFWVENPSTAPKAYFCRFSKDLAFPYQGPVERRNELIGIEQGDLFVSQEV